MSWIVPRIWDGADVWIIGGGPSVTRQFGIPDKVVQKVVLGTLPPSIYSPYMEYLHDKHVIGINVAYLIGDWIDMVFFGDSGFFLKHKQGLAAFPGLKISCTPQTEKYDWVKTMIRDSKHTKGISSNPKAVSWNNNSGSAAISIAVHAGAKRIFLLGFDMKLGTDKAQHWHNQYHRMENMNPRKVMHLPFDRHLMGFPIIAKDAQRLGVQIINVCPDSRIEEFKKVSLSQLI